jgi:hypothetical protein
MLARCLRPRWYAKAGITVALVLGTTAPAAQGTPAEDRVRDLIDAADRPCKLERPRSSGISEYDSGFGGVREVGATVVRKGVGGSSSGEVASARWEIRDDKLRPLDPMAGEINRRCDKDPGKPDSAFDWRSLPYFGGYDQAFLYLITNGRWDGAEEVKRTRHLPNSTGSQDWGEIGSYVWRGRCDPGADSVTLKRTIFLPGKPFGGADIRAGVNTLGGIFGPGARPVTEVTVRFNGQRILKVNKRGDAFDFDDVPARVFRDGANNVVIKAEKRQTGKCNKGRSSALVGVEFSLYATYGSDLAVEVPTHGTSGAFGIDVPFTVVNKGPSGIPEAAFAFSFTVHSSGGKAVLTPKGAGECDEQFYLIQPPGFGVSFVCRVRDIERGESKNFSITVTPGFADGQNYWSGSLSWLSRISGMGEVDGSNQNGGRTITGCRNGDTRCTQQQGRPEAALVNTRLLP